MAERLAAEVELHGLLGQGLVAGDEVAEDCVLAVADRRVEARRRACRRPHLEHLLNREGRLVGDLLERRLASELRPELTVGTVDLL